MLKKISPLQVMHPTDHRPLSFCIFADVNMVEESIDDDIAYAVVPDWKASDEHHRQEFQSYLCQLLLSLEGRSHL